MNKEKKFTENQLDAIIHDNFDNFEAEMVSGMTQELELFSEIPEINWLDLFDKNILIINANYVLDEEDEDFDNGSVIQESFGFKVTIESNNEITLSNGINTFADEFGISESYDEKVVNLVFTYMIKVAGRCPIHIFSKFTKKILEIMKEENFFDKYNSDELLSIYKLTENDIVLPKEATDIFIF